MTMSICQYMLIWKQYIFCIQWTSRLVAMAREDSHLHERNSFKVCRKLMKFKAGCGFAASPFIPPSYPLLTWRIFLIRSEACCYTCLQICALMCSACLDLWLTWNCHLCDLCDCINSQPGLTTHLHRKHGYSMPGKHTPLHATHGSHHRGSARLGYLEHEEGFLAKLWI